MNKVVENLKKAKATIGTPEKWCRGNFHLGSTHCMLGAIQHVTKKKVDFWKTEEARYLLEGARRVGSSRGVYSSIPSFNDDLRTKHTDVMNAFDIGICIAECASQEGGGKDE